MAKCIAKASGEYVKFLHDDDLLHPNCVERLVQVMESESDVAFVSSRRLLIDVEGKQLPDILATVYPFPSDVVIDGHDLISFLADYTINFIGEPSCILCRREDVLAFGEKLMDLNGKNINWVADLALYVRLLRAGNLIMLAEPLTSFQVSVWQSSQLGRDQPGIGEQGHTDFSQAVRDLGWYRGEEDSHLVKVAPLSGIDAGIFKPVDILSELRERFFNSPQEASVERWLATRSLTQKQQQLIEERLSLSVENNTVAVLILEYDRSECNTERTINSINNAKFKPELSIFKIKGDIESIPIKLNNAIKLLNTSWFIIVNSGDEFTSNGLLIAQLELAKEINTLAVSFDEIYRDINGKLGAALRPAFNLDFVLSFPAVNSRRWLFNSQAVLKQGGFSVDLVDAFELDLLLRLVDEKDGSGLAHIAEPLLITASPLLANVEDERKAILRHLHDRGYKGAELQAVLPGRYQLQYKHQGFPVVSIMLLAGDNLAKLQRCIEGLLESTNYQTFEILLLENQPQTVDVHEWLQALLGLGEAKLRVLTQDKEISSADLLNHAAQQAIGDYLLLLSSDTAVLDGHWLENLLNHAQRSEVGAVGGKLLSPDGKIAQAMQILGLQGPLGNPFIGDKFDEQGYMHRLQVDQNVSSLSSDCLMIPKELYLQAGGVDSAFAEIFQATDLCLRLREAGYFLVWTPTAQLMLDREGGAQPTVSQEDRMYAKWLPQLTKDPTYNSNLSLAMPGGFKLADSQISWRPLDNFRPAPVVLLHPADLQGCGHYRMIQPFLAMKQASLADGVISTGLMHVTDLERYNPDTIILQRQIGDDRLTAMQRMQKFSKAFTVYELDDYLPNLPLKSIHRASMPKDILRSLRKGLGFVDRFVVSTESLAEAFSSLHGEIVVMENRLPVNWWKGLKTQRRQGKKPRVGWAGGSSHTGDLELIADVVRDLADEVEWVFFGMCPESLRPYIHEFHEGVVIEQYPAQLAALNLDLGLAPLEINLFNECKSNLRQLEYGACGIPVICTDTRSFQSGLPVTLVRNRYKEWMDAIRMHINDLDTTAKLGDELQARVRSDWMLEGTHLERWYDAWVKE